MALREYEIIIIGGGPAGLTGAVYATRAGRSTAVIEKLASGGQMLLTSEMENFPGFPDGIGGPELGMRMQEQALKFGAEIISSEIISVCIENGRKILRTEGGDEYRCKALIIASGSSSRKIGVPGEVKFMGRGVSVCATCDAFFFRERDVVVIGGGDTAIQEAVFLTKFVKSVRIIHRREKLRAQKILQERAFSNPKISFVLDSIPVSINGEDKVESISVKNVKTGDVTNIGCDGVFVFIGWDPNTAFLGDFVELDEYKYIKVDHLMRTSVEGVFAAGEVRMQSCRQAITSAGDGACAAIYADIYLTELEDKQN